jgi:hypothetical protein
MRLLYALPAASAARRVRRSDASARVSVTELSDVMLTVTVTLTVTLTTV